MSRTDFWNIFLRCWTTLPRMSNDEARRYRWGANHWNIQVKQYSEDRQVGLVSAILIPVAWWLGWTLKIKTESWRGCWRCDAIDGTKTSYFSSWDLDSIVMEGYGKVYGRSEMKRKEMYMWYMIWLIYGGHDFVDRGGESWVEEVDWWWCVGMLIWEFKGLHSSLFFISCAWLLRDID